MASLTLGSKAEVFRLDGDSWSVSTSFFSFSMDYDYSFGYELSHFPVWMGMSVVDFLFMRLVD